MKNPINPPVFDWQANCALRYWMHCLAVDSVSTTMASMYLPSCLVMATLYFLCIGWDMLIILSYTPEFSINLLTLLLSSELGFVQFWEAKYRDRWIMWKETPPHYFSVLSGVFHDNNLAISTNCLLKSFLYPRHCIKKKLRDRVLYILTMFKYSQV